MKHKATLYYIILLTATLLGMWLLPVLTKKLTYKPDNYPFVYYSSLLEELCLFNYSDKQTPMRDTKGNTYTTAQTDSLLPLLNYRQLMNDNRLPDSIKGVEINPRIIRLRSFSFRFDPTNIQTPSAGLHILFESMPQRVGLTMPDDVFRMKDRIEFIDAESNTSNKEKNDKFQKELEKNNYAFPSQWLAGNPNPRKAYDEGYFCLDAEGKFFHLKMVNNRPYVRDTRISEKIDVAHFSMLEVPDKRFYGFLFSKQGDMYIIENEAGDYHTIKLDIPPISLAKDQVIIMGNLLYWTVSVITPDKKLCYGLDDKTLKRVAEHTIVREPGKWDVVSQWVFPVYLSVESKYSNFLSPSFHFTGLKGFVINILLAIFAIVIPNAKKRRIFNALYILVAGAAGLVALLLLSGLKNKLN